MEGTTSFRLYGGQRIDPPKLLASDYSPEELARFRKAFEIETKRNNRRGLILFVLVAPLIMLNFVGSAYATWGYEWRSGGFFLGVVAILFLVIRTSKGGCPACKRSLDASGEFCPVCGRRDLQPGSWLCAPKCSSCQKTMTAGKGGRNYRVRACTHCGLVLD
ncbi:hypothetical protein BH09VER1_BH09VER1_43990 [soil metagenome]